MKSTANGRPESGAEAVLSELSQPCTVVIASDSPFLRRDFEHLVTAAADVVLAGSCRWREVVDRSVRWRPDVILLDASVAPLPGLPETVERLRSRDRPPLVVLLVQQGTVPVDAAYVDAVLAADSGADAVVRALAVLASGVVVTTRAPGRHPGSGGHPEVRQRLSTLTEREREILVLIVDGLSNREVGSRLYISPDTVKEHVSRILAKLEVASRIEAAVAAVRAELWQ
ncbi:response regulator transcription factor [Nocardia sp. BMG51109]|uniref:LuxR C-terminal-related transcriptional regulator n=1 Tax=Nocardia sp. BMG51109 TaxID=1056816 RepID=UPI0018DC884A|nr:response regulator transcription factor [Nocardia sp. BMG51109]